MTDKELMNIWKSYDQKMDEMLSLNKTMAYEITKQKLHNTINALRLPKSILLVIGIPYTAIICFIAWIAYQAQAYIAMLGFGAIGAIMLATISGYVYHLYLLSKINHAEDIAEVQQSMAKLKISSYNMARLSVGQLPFWSICWMSLEALKQSPIVYGGINLIAFLLLSALSFYLYQAIHIDNKESRLHKLIFSGREWEPILKSADLLEQLKEYETASSNR
ncbi:MAG: hypothetical protein AAFV95_06895 [Bacteroidota bacterium]